jgi:molybdate transport system permease protein
MDWQPFWLTFRLAALTTAVLLVVGVPLAGGLAGSRFRGKPLVEALVSLPLVLPPSVLGFYWLVVFSPVRGPGRWLAEVLDVRLLFSFEGLLAASVLYSLPFMVHPVQAGLENLPASWTEAARTLGRSRADVLLRVLLPNCRAALLTGVVLSFAHTIGEFGLVLMIGGNLPGQTRVVSIAIYDAVERLDYATAHTYSAVLLAVSLLILVLVYTVNRRFRL